MRMKFGIMDSQAAVLQSEQILGPIREANPHVSAELVTVPAVGNGHAREQMRALQENRMDYAIQHLQHLPLDLPDDLPLVAYVRQADCPDGLVLPGNRNKPDRSKPLGCLSLSHAAQLKQLYPKTEILLLQGPIPALLEQLDAGAYSGLVLPVEELRLLGLEGRISRRFTTEELLPAAGQGILAIQTKRGTDSTPLKLVNDMEAAYCALAERAFARAVSRSSGAPTAAHAVIADSVMTLTGLIVELDGVTVHKADIIGNPQQAAVLGETLAAHLQSFHPASPKRRVSHV